jgi:predicted TIM-barrel fold metal-dependent hydrolase
MTTIDVHCHVFGVREIPVEAVLRRRFADHPARGILLPAVLALIEHYRDREGPPFELEEIAHRDPAVHPLLTADLARALDAGRAPGTRQDADPLAEPEQPMNLVKLLAWADLITETQAEITRRLVSTYPDVALFTPLALDMWDRFGGGIEQTVDQQVDELAEVIVEQRGRVHAFAPFDPKDDDEGNQHALDRALEAVRHRGFLGVKLYPSHGFRASGNAGAPGPDGRPLGAELGGRYDEALDLLFQACARHDIPITTHAASGGAVTHPAMADNAHPRHWDPVLRRYPLRLNMAHLGGYWHVGHDGASWTDAIAARMRDHRHVYADLSFQLIFAIKRKRMRRRHAEGLRRLVEGRGGVGDRLLYGSDWHMFAAGRRTDRYDERMREHLVRAVGDRAADAVMGGNALDFLGLRDGRSRRRLARFYAAHGIPLPGWWPA